MSELYIHVGYPKTATTWLQNQVFPEIDGLNYLGRFYADSQSRKYGSDPLNFVYSFNFDNHFVPDEYAFILNREVKIGQPNLISHEVLLRPFNIQRSVRRLYEITSHFSPTIIISLRRQDSLILSRYLHDISLWKKKVGIRRFFRLPPYEIEHALSYSNIECSYPMCRHSDSEYKCLCSKYNLKVIPLWFYNFFNIFELYESFFGEGNVKIILMEDYIKKSVFEIRKLAKLFGQTISDEKANRILLASSINSRSKTKMVNKIKKRYHDKMLSSQILEYYKKSNNELSEKTGIPLNKHGYF